MNEPNQLSDNTTAGFDMNLTADNCVDISAKEAIVGGRSFAPIDIADSIEALTAKTKA